MELELRPMDDQGVHVEGGGPRGRGRAPHPPGQGVGPLALILSLVFFINSKKLLRRF